MTKAELIDAVAEASGEGKAAAERVIDALTGVIHGQLADGKEVSLPGLGKFVTRDRAARTGRNPQTGQAIEIAATKVPAFKPAKALKDIVSG